MSFLVRRLIRTERQTGQKHYRELHINLNRLTVGRGVEAHLQVPCSTVEPHHADISVNRRGRMTIKAVTSVGFEVNGKATRSASLKPGDTVTIGTMMLEVEEPRDGAGVLTYAGEVGKEEERIENLRITTLTQAGLKKSPWAWFAGMSALFLFLLIPLAGLFDDSVNDYLRKTGLPDDGMWISGPVHKSHKFFGDDCTACHVEPFTMVRNQECEACHTDVQHHVPVDSEDAKLMQDERCGSCHREHNEPSILVDQDQRACTDCHGRMDELKPDSEQGNVMDFADAHPEFRLSILTPVGSGRETKWESIRYDLEKDAPVKEDSNLKFTHKDHLDPEGIESPDGDVVMDCADCHELDLSGRLMKPVTMEKQCSRCHTLLFDENDLNSTLPHGDPRQVYDTLIKHFSLVYLEQREPVDLKTPGARTGRRPGAEKRKLTKEEQKRSLEWASGQAMAVAKELLDDRLCVDCHEITKDPAKSGIDKWTVEPVGLTKQWMPGSLFDHASHYTAESECDDCHHDVEKSEEASDILMPPIEDCRTCHGGDHSEVGIRSNCLMCHSFHLPGKGLLTPERRDEDKQAGDDKAALLKRSNENRS